MQRLSSIITHTHTHTMQHISTGNKTIADDDDEGTVSKTRFESVNQPAQTLEYKEQNMNK